MDDLKELKGFLNTAEGKEALRSLKENLHDNLVRDAERENTPDSAFGLLKEASGVIKSIEHLVFLSNASMDEAKRD